MSRLYRHTGQRRDFEVGVLADVVPIAQAGQTVRIACMFDFTNGLAIDRRDDQIFIEGQIEAMPGVEAADRGSGGDYAAVGVFTQFPFPGVVQSQLIPLMAPSSVQRETRPITLA
jgi:hypothetical protein